MNALWAILGFIFTLTFLIFIHELGHFVTAKRSGVKVLEFGMGLPPRIWGKQRGETLYSINWIPLGGFCKMLGEEDPSQPGSLASKRPLTRLKVLSAGSLVMLVFPIFLFSLIYLIPHDYIVGGEEQLEITQVVPDAPADLVGLEVSDQILEINDRSVPTLDKLKEVIDENLGKEVSLTILRDNQEMEVSLVPRTEYPKDEGPLGVTIQPHSLVVREIKGVAEGSPAYEAGLQKGDKIVAINGTPVLTNTDYDELMADTGGKEITIMVLRDQEEVTVTLVPRTNPPEGQGPLGVTIETYYTREIKEHRSYWPWTAFIKGIELNKEAYVAMKDSLDQITFDQLGGVVAAGDATVHIAEERPWEDLVLWAGLLSINLGIINLFPIPALDGGRIVFVLIEIARRGKRVAPETEGMIHLIGFTLLLAFIVFITYQDIDRIISGDSLFS